ncbi:unnamed protein product [Owenia fusiformis]|uniref:Nicotinamide/nicotinic acid mononucleotide adenylyltransferase 1 n=1 Tax=Owenia fusiformis TaxID=6347 RepID=A0A8S4NQ61_OWEFU|nr:unnamed protein product [Owenia fusiformis]
MLTNLCMESNQRREESRKSHEGSPALGMNGISMPQYLLRCICMTSADHGNEIYKKKEEMGSPAKVVLLACGSFNPVTNMHLRMFELARDSLQRTGRYRVVGGIISPVNDKYAKKDLVSAKHRCSMVRTALKSSDWIRMDPWESEQEQWQETAKVLEHHQRNLDSISNANFSSTSSTPSKKRKLDESPTSEPANFPLSQRLLDVSNQNDTEPIRLKLLCGADLLESFAVPNLWSDDDIENIVKNYGLVCISRSGANAQKFIYDSDVLTRHQENIHLVTEWIQNEISATKIRRALRRGESVKYLLQDSVIDFIHEHNLYGIYNNITTGTKGVPHRQDQIDGDADTTTNDNECIKKAAHPQYLSPGLTPDHMSAAHMDISPSDKSSDKHSPNSNTTQSPESNTTHSPESNTSPESNVTRSPESNDTHSPERNHAHSPQSTTPEKDNDNRNKVHDKHIESKYFSPSRAPRNDSGYGSTNIYTDTRSSKYSQNVYICESDNQTMYGYKPQDGVYKSGGTVGRITYLPRVDAIYDDSMDFPEPPDYVASDNASLDTDAESQSYSENYLDEVYHPPRRSPNTFSGKAELRTRSVDRDTSYTYKFNNMRFDPQWGTNKNTASLPRICHQRGRQARFETKYLTRDMDQPNCGYSSGRPRHLEGTVELKGKELRDPSYNEGLEKKAPKACNEDVNSLVRRVKCMRVAMAPETCV